ncbi:MAG: thioredoxin fold domain-containing protein [Chloroflexi bacterium]|nr:thioredoxin fold domain-containing protein [Chloroflexota bacterium]
MNLSEFQEKISGAGKPVIVDFWAPWCVPCMTTKPILAKLAKEFEGKVEFLPINADESRETLERFKIFGIPTVVAMRDGKEMGRVTGAQNEAGYRSMFEALAEGREVKAPMTAFDRILRLGAGAAFMIIGVNSGNWLAAGIGGVIAFMGVYDRCPIWRAVMGILRKKT